MTLDYALLTLNGLAYLPAPAMITINESRRDGLFAQPSAHLPEQPRLPLLFRKVDYGEPLAPFRRRTPAAVPLA